MQVVLASKRLIKSKEMKPMICPTCKKSTEIIMHEKCPKCSSTKELMREIQQLIEKIAHFCDGCNRNGYADTSNIHMTI